MELKSCYSLSFLRPIVKAIQDGNLVVMHIAPANAGGFSWIKVLAEMSELREWIKDDLKKYCQRTRIIYKIIPWPDFRDGTAGYVPMEDGSIKRGAY
jgi:SepF-like predicted cell division protein (DUF552 family)